MTAPLSALADDPCAEPVPTPSGPTTMLRTMDRIHCFRMRFSQEKRIPELQKPIMSNGEMLYVRSKGILWNLEAPSESHTFISPKGLYSVTFGAEGAPSLSLLDAGPASKVFLILYSGDRDQIERYFKVRESPGLVLLTPNSIALAERISEVRIEGALTPKVIRVKEAQGAETTYTLEDLTLPPLSITGQERAVFDGAQS